MAKDKFHLAVREAVEKEGWQIVSDPFSARYADKRIEIDFEAAMLILAEREKKRIFVEVKSFLCNSAFYELHSALG
jgi:hypothetical protein